MQNVTLVWGTARLVLKRLVKWPKAWNVARSRTFAGARHANGKAGVEQ